MQLPREGIFSGCKIEAQKQLLPPWGTTIVEEGLLEKLKKRLLWQPGRDHCQARECNMRDYFAKRVQQRQRIYQNVKRSIIRERINYYSRDSMAVNMRLLKAIIELKRYHQGQQSTCEGRDSNPRGTISPGSPPMSYVACGLDFSSSPAG